MDEQLTLHEIERLEAQRKLRSIPQVILETAWVREAQIEAVIDAALAVTFCEDAAAYAHARHVGEWCGRIAAALPFGPEASVARRVGVLAGVDPRALDRIEELKHLSAFVRDYQAAAMQQAESLHTMSAIEAVAEEFDARLSERKSRASILREIVAAASITTRPIVDALCDAVHFRADARVA